MRLIGPTGYAMWTTSLSLCSLVLLDIVFLYFLEEKENRKLFDCDQRALSLCGAFMANLICSPFATSSRSSSCRPYSILGHKSECRPIWAKSASLLIALID